MSTGFDLQSVEELALRRHLRDSGTVFTEGERAHCRSRPDPDASLAGLFSAKEAFVKALSAMRGAPAHTFPEIEIGHEPAGRPRLRLHGDLGRWCRQHGIHAEVSISHTAGLAGAVVVLLAGTTTNEGHDA
ncbi:holo-ACP synthase [Streptomyces parvulus]|uniref:holo-ACP synthase n=1 Tax=Streptomyces parvulus TaxID=146923 RepID=UPI001E527921|nr:holo-ACP synthase [Streptomyces parvulus]MCC9153859.1 holo-ACP synthase [Streptomyces parvulus]MCE7689721.1 holo-ACP synthase [Streptomyces parvulus]